MSYSKHYSTKIHYSGTVSCSYPASEHGGSKRVHYDGYVPVDIDVVVDTDPFDQSVRDASGALGLVAGALSATEAAQVEQIRRSAKKISQTAIRGFYRTLTSELSAQVSEFGSSMKSTVGLLVEQGQQVEQVHSQMESDYHAIKARYTRLFAGLDRELDQRVHELDRPAFQLSKQAMQGVVARPYEESAAKILVHTQDTSTTPLKLMCARAKAYASHALFRCRAKRNESRCGKGLCVCAGCVLLPNGHGQHAATNRCAQARIYRRRPGNTACYCPGRKFWPGPLAAFGTKRPRGSGSILLATS